MINFDLEEYLAELKHIVAMDTGKFNKTGVDAIATYFEKKLRILGLHVYREWDGAEDYAPIVVAHNSEDGMFDVMLVAHLDTVFPIGTAAERPMTITEDGIIHGPGVEDCKSGALSIYYLAKELMEKKANDIKFCVILNSDEEVGSPHSVKFISSIAQKSKYCFVFEPGRDNGDFVIKRRGTLSYKMWFHGIAAHSGSSPEKGANAIVEMSRWVLELEKLNDLEKGISVNSAICNSGKGTLNIIPAYCELEVSFRYFDKESLVRIETTVEKMKNHPFDERITVEIQKEGGRMGMVPSAETEILMQKMLEVGEKMNYHFGFTSSGGGSDANEASEYIPSICACGPAGFCAHTLNEYIRLESIEPRLNYMYNLLDELFRQ